MMDIYYDCEFVDDGWAIMPISIGLVAGDGREYYAVFANMPFAMISARPWLVENVMPSLPVKPASAGGPWDEHHPDFQHVRQPQRIAEDVRQFITKDKQASLWGWYSAYDHVMLAQLWGAMINLPLGVPMWTNDLKQEAERLGNPELPGQDRELAHNALEDARWNKRVHGYLKGYAADKERWAVTQ